MQTHKKLNYIHIFRAISIIIIVAGHCFISFHPKLYPILNVLLQDGTVFFIFIAGFLFQHLSDAFSYKPYLKKKFFNVICPYLITSIIGIASVFIGLTANPYDEIHPITQVGMFLTTGRIHNPPTWYIPMTCILFLFSLLLLRFKKIIFNKYILFLVVCFSCFIPRYEIVITDQMTSWQVYAECLTKIGFYVILFIPVYILGMFFAKNKHYIQKIYQKRFYLFGLFLGASIVSFLLIYYSVLPGRLLFPKMLLSLLFLGYLEHYDEKIIHNSNLNNMLGTVGTYSFSIFFLHYYFILFFFWGTQHFFHLEKDFFSVEGTSFLLWFIYRGTLFMVAFAGSLLTSILIKKILEKLGIKHTRYFIGT